jgi:hypothetical protein
VSEKCQPHRPTREGHVLAAAVALRDPHAPGGQGAHGERAAHASARRIGLGCPLFTHVIVVRQNTIRLLLLPAKVFLLAESRERAAVGHDEPLQLLDAHRSHGRDHGVDVAHLVSGCCGLGGRGVRARANFD